MGDIIRFTHRDCKFRFDFHAGVGFRLFREQCNARENMRSGEWGDHWQELMEKYPDGTATLNNAICYCKNCGKYYTEPRVRFYVPKEGYQHEYSERDLDSVSSYIINRFYDLLEEEALICPDCEGQTEVIDDYNHFPCPKCGKSLKGRLIGNWD